MKGKLIVIEGGDGAGKKTQATLLRDFLGKQGITVKYLDFPQYSSTFGKLVSNYLRGEYGQLHEVPPEVASLLYTLDRYQFKAQIQEDLDNGVWYVMDRYSTANIGHQASKYDSVEERTEMIDWLKQCESRLPIPDIVYYLHMPVAISQRLMDERKDDKHMSGTGKKKDIHESNIDHLQRTEETFLLAASLPAKRQYDAPWHIVRCSEGESPRPIPKIHAEIVQDVQTRLGPLLAKPF
ncbi:MAG: thymidylate kinase [Candidatus Diapherotrites archaeon]|nr:thymidylate kinase [Candidatus Diapherotrites archaeon]